MHPVSAVIITLNEGKNIARCLGSLTWADEIIIIDSGSTDSTRSIAQSFNCRFIESAWLGYSATKQLGVNEAKNDWIFWIDADEEVSAELAAGISNCSFTEQAYEMPRKTFFLGKWIKHCGWYPGYVKRLFNRRHCRFGKQILHEGIDMDDVSKTGRLQYDLLHYSYQTLHQYFRKMNDYGKEGAQELNRKGKKYSFLTLLFSPFWNFIKHYFIKAGFLDGTEGFIISAGSAYSSFIKYANLYYLSSGKEESLR